MIYSKQAELGPNTYLQRDIFDSDGTKATLAVAVAQVVAHRITDREVLG